MPEIIRPEPAKPSESKKGELRPSDYNPDLAAAKQAEELIAMMGTPTILNRQFVINQGILAGLNHTKDNPSGVDVRRLTTIFDHVSKNSVNIDGKYFEKVWAYLMTPTYVIQGMGQTQNSFDEEGETIGQKIVNKFLGKKKNA